MPSNDLEDLVVEWYQFRGFFVRRNIQVGKRPQGGYDCELDVVAFHPGEKRLVHVEASLDADSWEKREGRYLRKFEAGRRYIPALFPGIDLPGPPEQIALFVFAGHGNHKTVGGGRIILLKDFMREILTFVRERRVASAAIPEEYSLLRTLQFAAQYWPLAQDVI